MGRIMLDIQGMSCGHCVGAVKRAIAAIEGASAEAVAVGSAEVRYDAAKTSEQAIVAAIGEAGYPARVVEALV